MHPDAAPARVLVVARDAAFSERVEEALAAAGLVRFETERAADLAAALSRIGDAGVDVALLRLQPPEGMRAIDELRRASAGVPIVAVLPTQDERAARAAFASGATDYVTEDHLDGEVLRRTLRYAIERRRLEGEAHRRSVLDEATGVYNARGFEQIGRHHLHLSARSREPVVLVFVRLDGGDAERREQLMAGAAGVLRDAVRDADVIGRLGTDTFGVLLSGDAAGSEDVVLARIVEAVATHNARSGRPAALKLSLGSVVHEPDGPVTLTELIREADSRMQRQAPAAQP